MGAIAPGTLESRRGNLEQARDYWMEAHQLQPSEAAYLIFAASATFELGDLKGGERLVRLATKCARGCIDEAWYNLGGYLVAQSRYEEALDCYNRAIEIDPDYDLALNRRGEILRAFPGFIGGGESD